MNTSIPAEDLKVGDHFKNAGSTRVYEVTDIVPAHRAEYVSAYGIRNIATGKTGTIACPPGSSVILVKRDK